MAAATEEDGIVVLKLDEKRFVECEEITLTEEEFFENERARMKKFRELLENFKNSDFRDAESKTTEKITQLTRSERQDGRRHVGKTSEYQEGDDIIAVRSPPPLENQLPSFTSQFYPSTALHDIKEYPVAQFGFQNDDNDSTGNPYVADIELRFAVLQIVAALSPTPQRDYRVIKVCEQMVFDEKAQPYTISPKQPQIFPHRQVDQTNKIYHLTTQELPERMVRNTIENYKPEIIFLRETKGKENNTKIQSVFDDMKALSLEAGQVTYVYDVNWSSQYRKNCHWFSNIRYIPSKQEEEYILNTIGNNVFRAFPYQFVKQIYPETTNVIFQQAYVNDQFDFDSCIEKFFQEQAVRAEQSIIFFTGHGTKPTPAAENQGYVADRVMDANFSDHVTVPSFIFDSQYVPFSYLVDKIVEFEKKLTKAGRIFPEPRVRIAFGQCYNHLVKDPPPGFGVVVDRVGSKTYDGKTHARFAKPFELAKLSYLGFESNSEEMMKATIVHVELQIWAEEMKKKMTKIEEESMDMEVISVTQ